MKITIAILVGVLIILDILTYYNFKQFVKKHENETIEDNLISNGASHRFVTDFILIFTKDMGNYSAQNLRAVYYWAKINGYDTIWQPKKMRGVQ